MPPLVWTAVVLASAVQHNWMIKYVSLENVSLENKSKKKKQELQCMTFVSEI